MAQKRIHRDELPPFHTKGDPEGDFYALAFVRGRQTIGTGNIADAHFVLNWSPSAGFSTLSCATVAADTGRLIEYSRGHDKLDSVEFALLTALQKSKIPLHAWQLFPMVGISKDVWMGDTSKEALYLKIRHRLCAALYEVRLLAWLNQSLHPEPSFQVDSVFPKPPDTGPDADELSKARSTDL